MILARSVPSFRADFIRLVVLTALQTYRWYTGHQDDIVASIIRYIRRSVLTVMRITKRPRFHDLRYSCVNSRQLVLLLMCPRMAGDQSAV